MVSDASPSNVIDLSENNCPGSDDDYDDEDGGGDNNGDGDYDADVGHHFGPGRNDCLQQIRL